LYFGGNSEMRGYDYLQFLGNKAFFTNAELRFPLIEAALTPIGVVGGLRGVMFFNFGGSGFEGLPMTVWTSNSQTYTPLLGYQPDPFSITGVQPVYGPPITVDGFRLIDSRASYGVGLETFALGFPIHLDWSWRTLFNKGWEDLLYAYQAALDGEVSGSDWFRHVKFSLWIGYDF
jgi:outer membrane protein assembly factor BamA